MKPRHWFVFLLLICMYLPEGLFAQMGLDFYYVDTTGGKPNCVLPHLYFDSDGTRLTPETIEDLKFVGKMLEKYPKMSVRLSIESDYRRFENVPTRLNRRRIRRVANLLQRQHRIDKKRVIQVPYNPWQFRGANEEPAHQLEQRRVSCECLFETPSLPVEETPEAEIEPIETASQEASTAPSRRQKKPRRADN